MQTLNGTIQRPIHIFCEHLQFVLQPFCLFLSAVLILLGQLLWLSSSSKPKVEKFSQYLTIIMTSG